MSAQSLPYLSPEEYLAIERKAEFKSEYYQGKMYAMAGGTRIHSLLKGYFLTQLNIALEGRGCFVFDSDMRVRVLPTGLYTYPDISVVCGEPVFFGEDTLVN